MAGASNANSGLRAGAGLARREALRFVRQPSRIIASIGTPLLIWGFLASGFARAIMPGADDLSGSYAAYLIPGVATLTLMFASIFSAMSLIEDRRDGFLRAVLVSPAPRWSLVGGKAVVGSVLATLQALIVFFAAPLVGAPFSVGGLALATILLFLTSLALTAMGLALAWKVHSSEGFHGVMNGLLMPMWLLSGSMYSYESGAAWLRPLMLVNPLFWANESIRAAMKGELLARHAMGVTAFAIVMVGAASLTIGRRP